ncbi:hypothetical protein ZWY2020_016255 [Hordeum vulgare]|nr:hypothetical protein ZWY2020_016255 [Hordeum vulgare]
MRDRCSSRRSGTLRARGSRRCPSLGWPSVRPRQLIGRSGRSGRRAARQPFDEMREPCSPGRRQPATRKQANSRVERARMRLPSSNADAASTVWLVGAGAQARGGGSQS